MDNVVQLGAEIRRGTLYTFSKWKFRASSSEGKRGDLLAIFTRTVGEWDDISGPSDAEVCLNVRDLDDRRNRVLSEEGPAFVMRVDGGYLDLFPAEELKKAVEATPHALAGYDQTASRYFNDRHKWPYKPMGYQGLSLVK